MPRLFYARIIAPAYDRPCPRPRLSPSRVLQPPALRPLSTEKRRGGWKERRVPRVSSCTLLFPDILAALSSLSDSLFSFAFFRRSRLRHKNGRPARTFETAGGLLKNALAPSVLSPLPHLLASPPLPLPRLSRESVSDLENARYPDCAPGGGRGSSESISARTPRACSVRACMCAHHAVVARIGSVSDGNFSIKDVRIKATRGREIRVRTLSSLSFFFFIKIFGSSANSSRLFNGHALPG